MHIPRLLFPLLALHGALLLAKDPAAPPLYLHPDEYPIEEILPPPPRPGTDAEKADRAKLLDTVAHRTQADLERAKHQERDSVFLYAEVLGADFNAGALPKLAALFTQVTKDSRASLSVAKAAFKRPRAQTPEAQQEEHREPGRIDYSFPSSHSTRAVLWATLLTELFPEQSGALLREARRLAWDRVLYGKHYPADVLAGRVYGEFLAGELLANPEFQKALKGVRAEVKEWRGKAAVK